MYNSNQPPSHPVPVLGGAGSAGSARLHPAQLIGAASAILALGASFFAYYAYELNSSSLKSGSADVCGSGSGQIKIKISGGLCDGATASAWTGIISVLGVVAIVAAGVLTAGWSFVSASSGAAVRVTAAVTALTGLVLVLVSLGVTPDGSFSYKVAAGGGIDDISGTIPARALDTGRGWAFWVIVVAAVVGLAGAVLEVMKAGRSGAAAQAFGGFGPGQPDQAFAQPCYQYPQNQYPQNQYRQSQYPQQSPQQSPPPGYGPSPQGPSEQGPPPSGYGQQ